jgi:hypothetical protein
MRRRAAKSGCTQARNQPVVKEFVRERRRPFLLLGWSTGALHREALTRSAAGSRDSAVPMAGIRIFPKLCNRE